MSDLEKDYEQYQELTSLLYKTVREYVSSQTDPELKVATLLTSVVVLLHNTKKTAIELIGQTEVDTIVGLVENDLNNQITESVYTAEFKKQKPNGVFKISKDLYEVEYDGELYEVNPKDLKRFVNDLKAAGSSLGEFLEASYASFPRDVMSDLTNIQESSWMVTHCLVWYKTPQCSGYWHEVYDKLVEIEKCSIYKK